MLYTTFCSAFIETNHVKDLASNLLTRIFSSFVETLSNENLYIYDFMLNTWNFLKTTLDLCLSSSVANILTSLCKFLIKY